jgi:hypothetical protein
MKRVFRRRYWVEVAASAVSAVMFLLTLARPNWVEAIFGVDPDGGSGELEWVLVAVPLVAALGCSLLAWREWRQSASLS